LKLQSIVKCPECGFEKEETMLKDSCQIIYSCTNCGEVLKPKEGKCCIFCSYGSEECPPTQEREKKEEETEFPKHSPLG
jgi:hypothetical protein